MEEVENNNYAVDQFEEDKYDLCGVSKYLSHRPTFSDRQNIMTRMGNALDTVCDPSMPYKRKIYGRPPGSTEKIKAQETRFPDSISNKTTNEVIQLNQSPVCIAFLNLKDIF